jgi:hypothetical protein
MKQKDKTTYIYLDQSDLSRLGKLSASDPKRAEIIEYFNNNNLSLIMSYIHIEETSRTSFQTIAQRNKFISEIKRKKVIKQFTEIVAEETMKEVEGVPFSPFYNNFYELAKKRIILSDTFGFYEFSKNNKPLINYIMRYNKPMVNVRKEVLHIQGQQSLSRKEIYDRYYNNEFFKNNFFITFPANISLAKRAEVINKITGHEIILPTLDNWARLRTELHLDHKRIPAESDINDEYHLVSALAYCDFVTTDRYFCSIANKIAQQRGNHILGQCYHFNSATSLLDSLKRI